MGYRPWGHKELGEDLLICFFKDNGINVICITCLHVNLHPRLEQCTKQNERQFLGGAERKEGINIWLLIPSLSLPEHVPRQKGEKKADTAVDLVA